MEVCNEASPIVGGIRMSEVRVDCLIGPNLEERYTVELHTQSYTHMHDILGILTLPTMGAPLEFLINTSIIRPES